VCRKLAILFRGFERPPAHIQETMHLNQTSPLLVTAERRKDNSHRQEAGLWPKLATAAEEPVAWVWISGLVVVATVLRVLALNQQLWFDEIVTLLESARQPIMEIVTHYGGQNQHMLYSLLAHGSIRLFGEQPWALRLPAVFFGVASIPALYFFGRLVTTNREALFASALMTVNYQHVWFSQNARGYTGMVFWTLAASIFFLRCVSRGNTRNWVLYGLAAALGIYTHLMMACVVVGHVLLYFWLLVSRARAGRPFSRSLLVPLSGFVLCGIASLLLYAPVIPRVLAHTVGTEREPVLHEWASPLWALAETVRGLRSGTAGGLIAVAIGGVILLGGSISYWRENRFTVGLMVLPGLITAVAVLATSHNFRPRYFFFEIGFAMLFVARGAMVLGRFGSRIIGTPEKFGLQAGTAAVLLMLLASVIPLRAEYTSPKQDYLGVMQFLDEHRQPGEQVVTSGPITSPYQQYYGRNWVLVQTRSQLDAALLGDHVTWLVYAMPNSIRTSQPEIWYVIESKFTVVRTFPGTLGGGTFYVSKSIGHGETDSHVQ
jgi:mannosyltransferase